MRSLIVLNFLISLFVKSLTADSIDNSFPNINTIPNYSSEYQDTQGWYSSQGKMIFDQPQSEPDTPDTNNSLDIVPDNLPGT